MWKARLKRLILMVILSISIPGMVLAKLPAGIEIKAGFQPGFGKSVGHFQMVQGRTLVIHKDIQTAWQVKDGTPLFMGDAIYTMEQSRARLQLNDESILTLGSDTDLVINKSVYDPSASSRSVFIKMAVGKARFWIKKLADYKDADFKIKTKTAIVGVRGSDFVVEATDISTSVTAFEKTLVEVIGLAVPCREAVDLADSDCDIKPVIVADFQRINIDMDALPSAIEDLRPDEIEILKTTLPLAPRGAGPSQTRQQVTARREMRERGETPRFRNILIAEDQMAGLDSTLMPDKQDLIERAQETGLSREQLHTMANEFLTPEQIAELHQANIMDNQIKKLPDFPGVPQ